MLEEINKYERLTFFDKINANINNEELKYFPNRIKLYRNNIKNTYEKEPNFIEIMHIINKQSKTNNIYQTLIKNCLKYDTKLIRLIYKTMEKISDKERIKNNSEQLDKSNRVYNFPIIDKLKIIREKYKKLKIKKIKLIKFNNKRFEDYKSIVRNKIRFKTIDEFTKYKINKINKNTISFPLTTKNLSNKINLSYFQEKRKIPKLKNNISFNSKDISISPSGTRINTESRKDSSINYNKRNESFSNISILNEKENNSFIFSNYVKSMNIIDKCNQEVKKGNNINNSVNQYKNDFDKAIHGRINPEELLDLDHKIIQEKKKRNNKYSQLEEKRIKSIKKEMKEKMSDNFAFENRKEFAKLIKMDEVKACNIHLAEIEKINENLFKKYKIERKKVDNVIIKANIGLKRTIRIRKKMNEIISKNKQLDKKINSSVELSQPVKLFDDEDELIKDDLISLFKKSQQDI